MGALRAGRVGGGAVRVRRRARGGSRRPGRAGRPRPVALVARPPGGGDRPPPGGVHVVPTPGRRPPRGNARDLSLRGAPDRRSARGGGGVARPRAPAARRCRHGPRARLARDRGGEAIGGSRRRRTARAGGAGGCPCAVRPGRRVHGARAARTRRRPAGSRRGGARPARRGDDRCTRWRDERPARLRRRMLHHARRLRQPRRPASGRGMVCGRRRVHGAAALHPRPVVVSRDLRRGPRPRGRLGARRRRSRRSARTAAQPRQAGRTCAAARRARRAPSAAGRMEDAATLLDGLDDEPAAIAPLVELSLERGDPAYAQALLDRRPDVDEGELLVLRGALALATGDIDEATSTAERLHDVAATAGRADLAAEAALLDGRAATVDGDLAAATDALEDAVVRFSTLQYPLEAARARLALARVQATGGSPLAPRRRVPRATPSRSSAPAQTPTGLPPCCASSVSRVARRPGASATSSRRASARSSASSPRGCRTPRSRSGS